MRSTLTFLSALGALLAGGCYTVQDLERQQPTARYSSSRQVGELTSCIVAGMRAFGTPKVASEPSSTRITLIAGNGYPAALLWLRPGLRGETNISVRQSLSYSMRAAVERCL